MLQLYRFDFEHDDYPEDQNKYTLVAFAESEDEAHLCFREKLRHYLRLSLTKKVVNEAWPNIDTRDLRGALFSLMVKGQIKAYPIKSGFVFISHRSD